MKLGGLGLFAISALASACAHGAGPVEAPMISAEVAQVATTSAPIRESRRPGAAGVGAVSPFERGDRLSGHYMCSQGRIELTLVVEDVEGDEVRTLFEFDYPGGGTRGPASGSFRMRGSFDARLRALRLDGDRWLEQPDGYAMVSLVGTVSNSGSISGTVKGPGCTSFYLAGPRTRAQEPSVSDSDG